MTGPPFFPFIHRQGSIIPAFTVFTSAPIAAVLAFLCNDGGGMGCPWGIFSWFMMGHLTVFLIHSGWQGGPPPRGSHLLDLPLPCPLLRMTWQCFSGCPQWGCVHVAIFHICSSTYKTLHIQNTANTAGCWCLIRTYLDCISFCCRKVSHSFQEKAVLTRPLFACLTTQG